MSSWDMALDDCLVTEAEKTAFDILPRLVAADESQRDRCATQLADILGNEGEFLQYVQGPAADRLVRMERLLRVFRENVELLIHKTWVDKEEEKPKARLLEDLAAFERDFRDGAISPAFKRFVALAASLASLLFGHQSRAEDFLVYCFRIDPKFGLFFWFIGEMEKQAKASDFPADVMRIETLIGIYAVSSF